MSSTFLQLAPVCMLLMVVQALAAVPWLVALWRFSVVKDLASLAKIAGSAAVIGAGLAFFLQSSSEPGAISLLGRFNASLLTLQLGIDFFVLVYYLLLTYWPKGGAVALAAFHEGVRQPMFWMLTAFGALAMVISIVIPYFTFGEDIKMVKEITYALTMIFPAIFGVISASISLSEELEGRTAVTLLSKPISRRDFLFGKFAGLTLAGAFMTMLMGWVLIWVVLAKYHYDFQPGITQVQPDPAWVNRLVEQTYGPTVAGDLVRGTGLWFRDVGEALPGLIIGFGQVMTLIAVSVALATRLPMVVNLTMSMFIYFLGHLAPIMTAVSQDLRLVQFIAQLFEFLLPGLANFDVSSAIVRDVPLDPSRYALYTLNVFIYATMYTSIAMLAGLILFEDRDVA
ncbi:MAG: ABC transporter permease [Planctomycetes bacterium]|nr:ABC transporter permease [Planctomycetota bacterium]